MAKWSAMRAHAATLLRPSAATLTVSALISALLFPTFTIAGGDAGGHEPTATSSAPPASPTEPPDATQSEEEPDDAGEAPAADETAPSNPPESASPLEDPPTLPTVIRPERGAASRAAVAAAIDPGTLVGLTSATLADALGIAWWGATDPGTRVTFAAALAQAPADAVIHIDTSLGTAFRFTTPQFTRATSVTITATPQVQLYFARLNFTGAAITFENVVLSPTANNQIALNVTTTADIANLQVANDPVTRRSGGTATSLNATTGSTVSGLDSLNVATGVNLATSTGSTVTDSTITGPIIGVNLATAADATVTATTIADATNGLVTTATSTAAGADITDVSIAAATAGISLGATTGVTISDVSVTHLGDPTNNAGFIGINVLNAADVSITDATISGFRDGISFAAGNTSASPTITGGVITSVVNCVQLGGSVDAEITGVTVAGMLRTGATVISTVGVEIAAATGTIVSGLTATDVARGINVPLTNTSTGLVVSDSAIGLTGAASATGVNLGGTDGARVTGVTVTGVDRTISRTTGVTTNRASNTIIDDVQVSQVATGIGATWVRLSGTTIPGPQISNTTVTDAGIGIYTANTTGTTVTDSTVDAWGEGVAGHEDADFTLTYTTVTGHAGTTFQNGTNCVRFYYTDGMTITGLTTKGGTTGLYLDMSYNAVAEDLDVSGATWYGTYAESITGYELRNSTFHDNAGIGNLTINPSSLDAIDKRQVSSDIVFEDNTFTDNVAGLYLPLGAFDITFQRNVVSGTSTYVLRGNPVHDLVAQDNTIDFTRDPLLLAAADARAEAPSLGDPPVEPPLSDVPEEPIAAVAASGATAPLAPSIVRASPIPPDTPAAAIWIAPDWYNLDTASASSSGVDVFRNTFTGDGPFVGVGTASMINKGTSDAPPNPSVMRTLRDTIEVSENVFPKDSTAIVTFPSAEVGEDSNPSNDMINGNVAVDAREETEPRQNDWGSPCGPRVFATDYDGGGAYIHEGLTTQVLYPEYCVARGSITKNVDGPDGTFQFELQELPDGDPVELEVTTVGGTATVDFPPLVRGAHYRISETSTPGWVNGSLDCVLTAADKSVSAVGSDDFVVGPGGVVACAVSNTAVPGAGTITKSSVGADGSFVFVLDTVPTAGAPVEVPVVTAGGSGSTALPDLIVGQRYSLVEQDLPGWAEGSLTCVLTAADGSTSTVDPTDFVVGPGGVVDCSVSNQSLPRLRLLKTVVPASFDPAVWRVTATPDGAGATVSGQGDTGLVEVTAGVDYLLSESAADPFPAEFTAGSWGCVDAGGGDVTVSETIGGEATLSGLSADQVVTCTIQNTAAPDVTVAKSVVSSVAQPDGSWLVRYEVTVSNASTLVDGTYDLDDQLRPGAGVTAIATSATVDDGLGGGPVPVPGWTGAGAGAVLADGVSIGPATTHTYELTVSYTVAAGTDFEPGGALDCANTSTSRAFRNTATLNGATEVDACAQPALPTISKTTGSVSAVDGAPGQWDVSYTITVTNGSLQDLFYTVTDPVPPLPAGATLITGPSFTPALPSTARMIPAAGGGGSTTLSYTATLRVAVGADTPAALLTCEDGEDGAGVLNTATLTSAGQVIVADACADVPVSLQVDKTWVVNGVDMTLADAPDWLASVASLTVNGVAAEWGARYEPFAAGSTVVIAETVDDSTLPVGCVLGDGSGDLGEQTLLSAHTALEVVNTVECAARPLVDKTWVSSAQQPDGSWLVHYTVTVSNTSPVIGVVYDLTDDVARFGDGITVTNLTFTPPGGTPVSQPDPSGPITLGAGVELAGGAIDVYTVTATATIISTPTDPADTTCAGTDSDPERGGFRNTAVVTDGTTTSTDTACNEPAEPQVAKSVASVDVEPGPVFVVTYALTVTNESEAPLYYDLDDALAYPAGIAIESATATNDAGVDTSTWNGGSATNLATEVQLPSAIAGPVVHTYTVVVRTSIAADFNTDSARCVEGAAGGYLNTATMTSGTIARPAEACADIEIIGFQRKLHDPAVDDGVESGSGTRILYTLEFANGSTVLVPDALLTDDMPDGLTLDVASIVAPPGWDVSESTPQRLVARSPSWSPGAATITYEAIVGDLPATTYGQSPAPLSNTACLEALGTEDCGTDDIPVKAITSSVSPACRASAAWLDYSLSLYNVDTQPGERIALIWWTPDAFAARDPHIPADDATAIIADGAEQVDYIAIPSGYVDGDLIEGSQAWPGIVFNADHATVGWPGWRQLPDGSWTEDADSPFAAIATRATVEFRVNPTVAADEAYPPTTPVCDPRPPTASLASTGWAGAAYLAFALTTLLLGTAMFLLAPPRRRAPYTRS